MRREWRVNYSREGDPSGEAYFWNVDCFQEAKTMDASATISYLTIEKIVRTISGYCIRSLDTLFLCLLHALVCLVNFGAVFGRQMFEQCRDALNPQRMESSVCIVGDVRETSRTKRRIYGEEQLLRWTRSLHASTQVLAQVMWRSASSRWGCGHNLNSVVGGLSTFQKF